MKKNNTLPENYLERIPVPHSRLKWTADDEGKVTLEIENKGVFNRIAQKLFKKPKISYVHLDSMGSFVWPLMDGKRSVTDLGVFVKEHFGDEAEPLYPRLAKYFQILDSYTFIEWKKG